MYVKNDVDSAVANILRHIDAAMMDRSYLGTYKWVYEKYDLSWYRMFCVMNDKPYSSLY